MEVSGIGLRPDLDRGLRAMASFLSQAHLALELGYRLLFLAMLGGKMPFSLSLFLLALGKLRARKKMPR